MDEQSDRSSQDWGVQLLGCWELRRGEVQVIVGAREQRLVAFLSIMGRRLRSYVAGVLWPESTQERAQGNARAAVFQLRRAAPGLLDVDRMSMDLAPGTHVDVRGLRCCLERVVGRPEEVDVPDALRILDTAELMPGWYEDWVIFQRGRLDHERVRALETLAALELERRHTDTALAAARAAVAIEPLRDSARALEIQAHLLAGNVATAIQVYHAHASLLRRELGLEPPDHIRRLVAVGGSTSVLDTARGA